MCAAMLAEKAGAPSPGFPVAATLLQRLQWAKKTAVQDGGFCG